MTDPHDFTRARRRSVLELVALVAVVAVLGVMRACS